MKKPSPPHVLTLKNEFDLRVDRNKNYSLRAYARDLGLSPAALSGVLNLKKGLSEMRARELASRLGLTLKEQESFALSVRAHHSRSPIQRKKALECIRTAENRQQRKTKINVAEDGQIQSWYSLALLELMSLDSCTHEINWFAKKLQLNSKLVSNALKRLLTLGLAEYKNGRYRAAIEESYTDIDVPSKSVKKFHAEVMKKAEDALFEYPVAEREFLNMTMAFPINELQEAKQMIRDFQAGFAERFYNQSQQKKNSVYQFSVQFFRIDHEKESIL